MGSLLGFLGALGDSAGIGSPEQPNALTRLNNDADPLAAAQRQMATQQAQTQASVLASLDNDRKSGITDPYQIGRHLAQLDPQYVMPMAEAQLKNPYGTAMANMGNGKSTGNASPNAAPKEDPYNLKPESPDDKRNYDFLNTTVPPQYRALVRQISNGDESVGNADSLRSNGMLALASQFDPSLSKTDFVARQATAKDNSSGGKSGQAVTSANTAVKHLAQVAVAGLELHNGSNQFANYISNKASQYAGNDPTTNLMSTVDTVAPELAKAAASGGDTTESDRNAQKDSFGISQSPEQLLGAVAGKADLINSKMEEVGNTYKTNMGGRQRQTITPENKQILDDLKNLHQFAKDGKLDDPKAQDIVARLKFKVGQQPESSPTIDKSAAMAEAKRRGLIK